jgi:RNA polymerase primary sigma factor
MRPRIYRQVPGATKLAVVAADAAETIHRVVVASRQMLRETGREPTPEELAEKLGIPLGKIRMALKNVKEPILLENPYA